MNISLKYREVENAMQAYSYFKEVIATDGSRVTSRNELTKEALNVAVLIKNIKDRVVPIPSFKHNFILQETFDILNENQPRVMHSKEMLEKTMGNSKNIFFFGNEMRQAFSRWSLYRIKNLLESDKYTRKAILDLGTRRPVLHAPCMIYAHFIIRNDELHMIAETRGTEISVGFVNDIYFYTVVQEIMYGWLLEKYPDLKLGTFLYKTTSLHYFDSIKGPVWPQEFTEYNTKEPEMGTLTYNQYVREMGTLYYHVDQVFKAREVDDIDSGVISTYNDIVKPDANQFLSPFFYEWANKLTTF